MIYYSHMVQPCQPGYLFTKTCGMPKNLVLRLNRSHFRLNLHLQFCYSTYQVPRFCYECSQCQPFAAVEASRAEVWGVAFFSLPVW